MTQYSSSFHMHTHQWPIFDYWSVYKWKQQDYWSVSQSEYDLCMKYILKVMDIEIHLTDLKLHNTK